jgi:hypothetical protein
MPDCASAASERVTASTNSIRSDRSSIDVAAEEDLEVRGRTGDERLRRPLLELRTDPLVYLAWASAIRAFVSAI